MNTVTTVLILSKMKPIVQDVSILFKMKNCETLEQVVQLEKGTL